MSSISEPPSNEESPKSDESLVLVPIPTLLAFLISLEKQKGLPLTEDEVLAARDDVACIALPVSEARALAEARGYDDINPEDVWNDWLEFKSQNGSTG